MDQINMNELIVGDVFTHEIKAINREAFLVIKKQKDLIYVTSRNDKGLKKREIKKQPKGKVYWLRNIHEKPIEL
jgi:hypothetical protein